MAGKSYSTAKSSPAAAIRASFSSNVVSCGVGALFSVAKILKMSYTLALANGLTALYGFPPNAIITENTCKALGQDQEEVDYLMSEMYPSMIVGGFTTVTITSVIIAGLFANLF